MIQLRPTVLVAAILLAALSRLLPHPPNFAPIMALGLFGGAYLTHRWAALAVPLAALLLSDLLLGFYQGQWVVYLATAASVGLGLLLRENRTVPRVGLAAVAGTALFFVVTNFAVWATSGMYPLTSAGLAACYVAALPFLQNSLAGDLLFTGVLFGGFSLLERSIPGLRPQVAYA